MIAGLTMSETAQGRSLCTGLFKVLPDNSSVLERCVEQFQNKSLSALLLFMDAFLLRGESSTFSSWRH